ncbi:MAG: FAD-binding protein [Prevotellaceae bacterium]|jgi:uncharacterized FAD-dependent dehydrogenase|nr:FAD-binding protein [Prevotellaceae bacterium]
MIHTYSLRLLPEQAADERALIHYLTKEKGLTESEITATRIVKRSIDARQRTIYVQLTVDVYVNEQPSDEMPDIEYPNVGDCPPVIVVGAGPAGLFAALRLIELGLRPIVVERGKNVRERKKDLARITREQAVDSESNYSFGEGGAGAYSDGKLYTRSKKRGNVEKVLRVFCKHGASASIRIDAHPHIGTDRLPRIIENIRCTILNCGGEVHFGTRMDALIVRNGAVVGIETNTGRVWSAPVILATGHSARDVYRQLAAQSIAIEAKGIAVGVRLEHPAHLIDQIQYHNKAGRGRYLPAAEYSFVMQSSGRGVYSFCMCPGGVIVPAATASEQVVVNGMSPSGRNTRWSNAGIVVELRPEDVMQGSANPLSVMEYQEELERQCWLQGGMKQTVPAQRMGDFVARKLSFDLPESSYAPGVVSSPLHFWLPSFISDRLSDGFRHFGQQSRGFLTNEAIAIGVETRTSAPVRILRDTETLQHIEIAGLFPCGEGAGYAGGIVSAAIDGERCAEAVYQYVRP